MVWSESLRDPALDRAVLTVLPGFLFATATSGGEAVDGVPDAIRAVWTPTTPG